VATRLAGHYTHSTEDKQSQPGANGIENSQIRLTDGSVIFTPDLFGPGITVEKVAYDMVSVDGGVKYKGLSLDAEYYWRWLSNFRGANTGDIADIDDHGFQVQSSAMVCPRRSYFGRAAIRGRYGSSRCLGGRTGISSRSAGSGSTRVDPPRRVRWDTRPCPIPWEATAASSTRTSR
jgi:hypothetical protein